MLFELLAFVAKFATIVSIFLFILSKFRVGGDLLADDDDEEQDDEEEECEDAKENEDEDVDVNGDVDDKEVKLTICG
jgi:hypothetical protein